MRADFIQAHRYGSGHINDTFLAEYDQSGLRVKYIHQCLSEAAFKNPVQLMENIARVCDHNLSQLIEQGHPEAYRRTLTLIKSKDGKPYAIDANGRYWRTYLFIDRARTYDFIESREQAIEAAKAFGEFQKLAATLPGEPLHETIPDFHNTKQRYANLAKAIAEDKHGRAAEVQDLIDEYMKYEPVSSTIVDKLESGELPTRVTHNDTKLNNVMLDDVTMQGICVIDLDTTMPGSTLYDFGDMVRTATCNAPEDESQLDKVIADPDMFEALVEGYLSSAKEFLTDTEMDLLGFAGKLITIECGVRFLTDYLDGDVYFRTHYDGQNISRCKRQLALAKSLEAQNDEFEKIIAKYR
ncbi:aminoglycoside phosphotransferase family protein [Persicirhabdus sediminis]|uniref:Aminoglycoside phosphotransferase family protein n=2 Tax=Persicirhabdus sediminis TaxID=454144 RepID=A0A8J7SNB2_9BACT|nr:aminoglycoside phosphotransferase family protein [Persicirhabdus sediminis]